MESWPFSPFARPISSFNLPVPPPVPAGGFCDQSQVTFPTEWLPYILQALKQLTLQTTWQGDQAAIAEAQDIAWNIINSFQAAVCQTAPQVFGEEVDTMAQIRVDCDCRVFITCCDGSEVELLTTKNPGKQQPGQPGAGAPQPPPNGGRATFCGNLDARGTWLLPTTVSTGDVITMSELFGGWTDTPVGLWFCPDGWLFVNGACFIGGFHSSLDPLPTALHMGIIATINGTAYDIVNPDANGNPQPFTVPGGISNAQVTLTANSPLASIATGDIAFCAEVQNNQVGTWVHDFNLRSNPGVFSPVPVAGGIPGSWSPSNGWVNGDYDNPSGNNYRGVDIISTDAAGSYTITDLDMTFDMAGHSFQSGLGGANAAGLVLHGSIVASITFNALVDGTGQHLTATGLSVAHSDIELDLNSSYYATSTFAGSCAETHLQVKGTGTDPWL